MSEEKTEIKKPESYSLEHQLYLDNLRLSSLCNMWGARVYLLRKFPELEEDEAGEILIYWMNTFKSRQIKK